MEMTTRGYRNLQKAGGLAAFNVAASLLAAMTLAVYLFFGLVLLKGAREARV